MSIRRNRGFRTLVIGAAIAGLGLGLWLWKTSRSREAVRHGEMARAQDAMSTAVPSRRAGPAPLARGEVSQPPAGEENMESRIKDADDLRTKALLTEDEKTRLHRFFGDPRVIRHVEDFLLNDRPKELTPTDQKRRMDSVQLLADALRWKENPIRGEVASALKAVIASDNYHQIAEPHARKSVAADRYELYLALDDIMPDEAAQLLADSKSTPNAKLIAYAAGVAKNWNHHSE